MQAFTNPMEKQWMQERQDTAYLARRSVRKVKYTRHGRTDKKYLGSAQYTSSGVCRLRIPGQYRGKPADNGRIEKRYHYVPSFIGTYGTRTATAD